MARYYTPSAPKVFMYAVGILLLLLVLAFFSRNMYRNNAPGSFGAKRAQERKQARLDLQKSSAEALSRVGWADSNRGLVRLPIGMAMDMTVQQYQNPASARSNLLERVRKANVPPPAAPQKPSDFE